MVSQKLELNRRRIVELAASSFLGVSMSISCVGADVKGLTPREKSAK